MSTMSEIDLILRTPSCDWTADEKATIAAATAPLKSKSVKQMTPSEKYFLQTLFRLYFSHADPRARAIAYAVILAGVPTASVGRLRLEKLPAGKNPQFRAIEKGASSVYAAIFLCNSAHKTKSSTLGLDFNRVITLDGAPLFVSNLAFNEAIINYIEELRGVKEGPLFYQLRRAKGDADAAAPPPVSSQSAGRLLTEAATALGLGGHGQRIQFYKLAFEDGGGPEYLKRTLEVGDYF